MPTTTAQDLSRIVMPDTAPPLPAPIVRARADTPIRLDEVTIALDTNPAAVYLASLSRRSRRTMQSALTTIARRLGYADAFACPWQALRYQHTAAIRAALSDSYAPATANRMLAALRRVLKECWRLDLVSADTYRRAADIAVISAQTLPKGRALSLAEVHALLVACADDPTPAGVRDAALIAVLVATGLRRSEAVDLDLADYTPDSGALLVRQGKGRKDRIVYVLGGAAQTLADWLRVRGDAAGALFWATTRGGHLAHRRLSDQAIARMLARRARLARVAPCTPHDLRRTMISQLLDAGADLSVVQQLAGHASPSTTARYDRRGERAKMAAAGRLDVPYVGGRRLSRGES